MSFEKVKEEFELAKKCLCCPHSVTEWHRETEDGMYHLWTPYHLSSKELDIDKLLMARILVIMYEELHFQWKCS